MRAIEKTYLDDHKLSIIKDGVPGTPLMLFGIRLIVKLIVYLDEIILCFTVFISVIRPASVTRFRSRNTK